MSRYCDKRRVDSICVNVETDGQHEVTRKQCFVSQDPETGHGVAATFTLQLDSSDNMGCLCSNSESTYSASLFVW